MHGTSRRGFLRESLMVGSATLVGGWANWSEILAAHPSGLPFNTQAPGGTLLGTAPFVGEAPRAVGQITDVGHEGRLALDLRTVTDQTLLTPNEDFFIRTRYPSGLQGRTGPWTIALHGLVEAPVEVQLSELESSVEPQGTYLLECSGNGRQRAFGLLSAATWDGIRIGEVLRRANVKPEATRVLISGFDEHDNVRFARSQGASWVFTFEQLESARAFLATRMNGEPLPKDHGFPVRLIVPGWYGCTCAKWVNEIVFVDDSAASTNQMKEYAARTHQDGTPDLARDFSPATMDQAALPIRVEKWKTDAGLEYRVFGVMWGGDRPTDRLAIQLGEGAPYVPVDSYEHRTNSTWTLWSHAWTPKAPGRHDVLLRVDDPTIRTRRLDRGSYKRTVEIAEI